mmetsp:Transcript_55994/g.120502  ORF Transcript_55994/g.120502 Transcript_55994/m.120502 type:complete len:133 (+) Transcript_55994:59-457(+)
MGAKSDKVIWLPCLNVYPCLDQASRMKQVCENFPGQSNRRSGVLPNNVLGPQCLRQRRAERSATSFGIEATLSGRRRTQRHGQRIGLCTNGEGCAQCSASPSQMKKAFDEAHAHLLHIMTLKRFFVFLVFLA